MLLSYFLVSFSLSQAVDSIYPSSCVPDEYCIYAGSSSRETRTIVTIHAACSGWFGFGVAETAATMGGGPLYVLWRNATGGFTVVEAVGDGVRPTPVKGSTVKVIALQVPVSQPWVTFAVTITIPKANPLDDKFMWASNKDTQPLGDLNDVNAVYREHTKQGIITNPQFLIKPSAVISANGKPQQGATTDNADTATPTTGSSSAYVAPDSILLTLFSLAANIYLL
jgi:hypothetical protein